MVTPECWSGRAEAKTESDVTFPFVVTQGWALRTFFVEA